MDVGVVVGLVSAGVGTAGLMVKAVETWRRRRASGRGRRPANADADFPTDQGVEIERIWVFELKRSDRSPDAPESR